MPNPAPRLHIVLVCPEIPQNTGNIGRLCAFAALRLHLIHPLGFAITDRHLRRAGMDYWKQLDVRQHANWEAFLESPGRPERLWLLTTRGDRAFWDAGFQAGDGLVFGSESAGAPESIHQALGDRRLVIPRFGPELRSLNLSTSVGIAAYEALRKIRSSEGQAAGFQEIV